MATSAKQSSLPAGTVPVLLISGGLLLACLGHLAVGVICLVLGLLLYFRGKSAEAEEPVPQAAPESLSINLTNQWLEEEQGWAHMKLDPAKFQYIQEYCFGGPPTIKEIWEYQVKEPDVVFQRLRSASEEHIDRTEYEVVDGVPQEDLFARKNQAHATWLATLPPARREAFNEDPYSKEKTDQLRAQTVWHQANGVTKYAVLLQHDVEGPWREKASKLRASFKRLESDALAAGAVKSPRGHYSPPPGCDELMRKRIHAMFSDEALLRQYEIPSYRDWNDREQILKLLSSC